MMTRNQKWVRSGLATAAAGGALGLMASPWSIAPAQAQMMGMDAIRAALPADRAPEVPTPDMQDVLNRFKELKPKPLNLLKPSQARMGPTASEAAKQELKRRNKHFPEDVGLVADMDLPTQPRPIHVRVYKPKNAGSGPMPVLMYFHGGGFVIASIATYDASCRAMANATGAMVVAVAYRMAPEHKLPAAHEDCYAATQYVMNNVGSMGGNPSKVAVLGESAGGNLATDMCLMARMRGGKMPIHQALIYPYVDMSARGLNAASMRENTNASSPKIKFLTREGVAWFNKWALPSRAFGRNPLASPLYANVRGLPPATIVLAEIDPLRTQGALYAQKLMRAGMPTKVAYYTGVTHEFFGMGALVPKAKQANQFVAGELKRAFSR
jgi:acetyl esterase